MENVFFDDVEIFYEEENEMLILGDTFSVLEKIKPESMDMIFAGPP